MSAKRLILAGVLGGIAIFIWTAIAHMATPLGEAGIKEIPNEQAVLSAMQTSLGSNSGLYFFPGMGLPPDAPQAEKRAAMNNYQQLLDKNPTGILVYKPAGQRAMTAGQLMSEFGFEVIEALLLAVLISMTTLNTFSSRLGFAVVVGLIAAVTTNMSYWNWYGFPTHYTLVTMFIELIKYVVAGIVIAVVAGRAKPKVATAAA